MLFAGPARSLWTGTSSSSTCTSWRTKSRPRTGSGTSCSPTFSSFSTSTRGGSTGGPRKTTWAGQQGGSGASSEHQQHSASSSTSRPFGGAANYRGWKRINHTIRNFSSTTSAVVHPYYYARALTSQDLKKFKNVNDDRHPGTIKPPPPIIFLKRRGFSTSAATTPDGGTTAPGTATTTATTSSTEGDTISNSEPSKPKALSSDPGFFVKPPTRNQLRRVFIASAIPFIGFGFLDNFLMILMGDAIDASLCVKFGFSTMAAAALGNTFSDVCGVFSGGVIEDYAQKRGIEMPALDSEQLKLTSVKTYQYGGQACGIVVGCILGMCPLLWMDPDATEKLKKEKTKIDVLNRVVTDVNDLLNAEATFIMMIDREREELYTVATENIPEFRAKLNEGVMGHCATTKKFINIPDLKQSEFFDPKRHTNYRNTGRDIKSVLCMPVLNLAEVEGVDGEQSSVIAVVEAVNKKADTGFTHKDEEVIAAICSHIATALADDEHRKFKNVIDMCRAQIVLREQYTTMNPVIEQRQMKLFETLMEETSAILKAEASHLLLIDPVRQKLRTKVGHVLPLREFALDEDIMGKVCRRGQLVNSTDFQRSKYYKPEKHDNYLGTGLEVRTRLCVPVINTERHVIGCLEVINKKSNEVFNMHDIEHLLNIAGHVALTLEGHGSSIKKVLALAQDQRQLMQDSKDFKRTATRQLSGPLMLQVEPSEEDANLDHDDSWDDEMVAASEHVVDLMAGQDLINKGDATAHKMSLGGHAKNEAHLKQKLRKLQKESDLVVHLDRAADLPKADLFGTIDPYITVSIVEGDPKAPNYDGPTKGRGHASPLGHGKSVPIRQNQNPVWNEKINIALPEELVNDYENLYLHIKLWDWDFMKSDDMIGEVVYPLKRVLQEDTMQMTSFPLTEIKNNPDEYDLKKSRIWLKFSIAKKKQ
ncbi:unnamed protein product [Amoebophrya sp. A120]|nr:unnamed protein product [Amoebophrya sp. A120]|eukprot:GSA120T00017261001.1